MYSDEDDINVDLRLIFDGNLGILTLGISEIVDQNRCNVALD